ncbi:bifunctional ADP-dependent NAD(P)H-hydrate dehydratase/NAD(P)H-hydrate epimerase [Magnetospirillum molischianum]|uniref:Bifunctional NAD(P)H-hydrate repair enzyme n=1 Tax=Magnetospirillum molischianum DSM 120 TaxID=1150626 RepID=H8FVJ3_MAGML|nr:bifunctional ADP-dependent NAD(P)H-hydrate dehydratase/NAD(P)H-hydrate epimerase [Magnetospirillum molischianum]CCG42381.1 conserved hypothetical protein; YjeF-related protein; Putative kinase, ribokinase-like superfamily [Magnetospirillum molischianum DSM 120]
MAQELLTVAEMARADALTIASGFAGEHLMEAAGWAVARQATRILPRRRVAILCGPGNNGGDGFVAARLLARRGWPVRVALLGERGQLRGDAALMAARWTGPVETLSLRSLDGCGGVIDALFGAGLSRPLNGIARDVIEEIGRRRLPTIAIDVPSGVDGDSGEILGAAADCLATVTFFRKKPGHCLLPGRLKCGVITVADIGIPDSVLTEIAPKTAEAMAVPPPAPKVDGHKYRRGHVLVVAGGSMTGAARLAALAARRIGAGLATIAAPAETLASLRATEPGTLITALEPFELLLSDPRRNAIVIGPGAGRSAETADRTLAVLATGRAAVLDADSLTSFRDAPNRLFAALSPLAVLTPHDGEYTSLFGSIEGSRLARARMAAARSGAVMLLKGPDTVIAHPDGRTRIVTDAPPDLATAGSGDVLAGIIGGLLAQGLPPFEAAASGAALHGRAGRLAGRGMIAEDMMESLRIPSFFA